MDGETWVFDVDGTLVDSLTGTSLRPGAADLLQHLRTAGARISVWSAGGARHARERLTEQGLAHLVDGFLSKGGRGDDGRYEWEGGPGSTSPVFVDDHPEDLPAGAEVIAVSPYIAPNPHDRGLAPAQARSRSRRDARGGAAPT